MLPVSIRPQCSAMRPSRIRTMSIASTLKVLPEGAAPMKGPSWLPLICSCATSRSPLASAGGILRRRTDPRRDQRLEGPVRITALDALIDYLIIPRLSQLLDRHPRLEVTFTSDFRILDLSRREADVAIRASKPVHPDAVGRRLGRQAIAAYAARGFPLDDQPRLIGLPHALDGTLMTKMLAELFPRGRIVARCNSEGQMISLARAGVGIALIDCFAADPDPRLQRIGADPIASYDMWTVSHVDLRQTPRVRAVTEFLTAIYREEADLLAGLKPAS